MEQEAENEGDDLRDCLKNIDLKDVIYWIANAWNNVKQSTIQKSWNKIIDGQNELAKLRQDECGEDEGTHILYDLAIKISGFNNIPREDFDAWIQLEENDEEELSNLELINLTNKNEHPNEKGEDAGTIGNSTKSPYCVPQPPQVDVDTGPKCGDCHCSPLPFSDLSSELRNVETATALRSHFRTYPLSS
ncbi:hypothetical protein QE152_g1677 [Popillia japonica]|uniref:DDE-1 domain-containing protein n=1 Tax=Popillia japonica TaxID=7064 RepID=A0AAW1N6E8_POPJA